MDAQSKSLHYIQVYAVKDRVDFSKLSNSPPPDGQSVYNVLPTTSDYQVLKDNFVVLVSRTLVEYIPFFSQDFKGLVDSTPAQFLDDKEIGRSKSPYFDYDFENDILST